MVHTWQANHLPKLDVANIDVGDVVLCGAFRSGAPILTELDMERVGFVAPLSSRADVEWLLRGLHLHPHVGHLILFGDDLNVTAEALLALWNDGLGEDGQLPGSRGHISADFGTAATNTLCGAVQIHDFRGCPADEVANALLKLPVVDSQRQALMLPNPEIPRRKVFMSRKTSFPIFSRDVGDGWLQLLNLAFKIGCDKENATGERFARALNTVVTIGLPVIAEDLEVEEVPQAEAFPDILDFNREDFARYYQRYQIPEPTYADHKTADYGGRLHAFAGIDQIHAICERLGRARTQTETAVILEPGDFADAAVVPNLISASFSVEDDALYASFVLRSLEVYTDWPLEALALIRLQQNLANRLGLQAGPATFVLHAIELYQRDWERTTALLDECFKRPLPLQVDPSGVFLFGNDGGKARGMLLDHDAGTIFWEDAFDTAQELSWYIVDAMPWLLPQHIRYVGQESSTLTQAMQTKECYLQG
jgi:hypothetical protein